MPSTAMMPETETAAAPAIVVTATIIGMPAIAGTTVQTARTPVTVGMIASRLEQQGSS
jgi:hypothetical protein